MKLHEKIELIAQIAHSANYYYCMQIGDTTAVPWDFAADWQKDSAVEGVRQVLARPYITPEELHVEWMTFKTNDGWVYGEKKCPMMKTHPCLVPYDQLPHEQKVKDLMFRTIVTSLKEVFDEEEKNKEPGGKEQPEVQ